MKVPGLAILPQPCTLLLALGGQDYTRGQSSDAAAARRAAGAALWHGRLQLPRTFCRFTYRRQMPPQ